MKVTRRTFIKQAAAVAGAAALRAALPRHAGPRAARADARPNVLWIMTDDQEWQSWALPYTRLDGRGQVVTDGGGEPVRDYAMRYLRSYPGGGWTDFTQNTCTSAICAPSRAALLTGVPAREHGVMRNGWIDNLDESNTLAVWLSEAGYETHLRGKYSFGDGKRGRPTPPGWTTFNGNGGRAKPVFDAGEQLVRDAAQRGMPWLICLWPTDPHRLARPSAANAAINLLPPPLPDNINEADVSDKPEWVSSLPLMTVGKVNAAQKERKRGYQALMGVDQGAQRVIEALIETGQFDNTIILFTADNGDSFGAHRLLFKDMIYDEASRVPLAIRLPWLTENRVENRVVSHLDVTATIVAATGIAPGRPLLGSSLLPLMETDGAPWEGCAFVESHGSPGARAKGRPSFKGLRTGGDGWGYYAYAEHPTGEVELYDLAADPAELDNAADRPEYAGVRAALAARLGEFLARPGYEDASAA